MQKMISKQICQVILIQIPKLIYYLPNSYNLPSPFSLSHRQIRMKPVEQDINCRVQNNIDVVHDPSRQKYHMQAIEPSRTVRPQKNLHTKITIEPLNTLIQPLKYLNQTTEGRKTYEHLTNHSDIYSRNLISSTHNSNNKIPNTYQSDILWKTQISESFIQKLEEFQSSSQLQPNFNPSKKCNHHKKMQTLQNQVIKFRLYAKETNQKMVEMHRVYSEGNKKSIELVMLIVKQLQKQNKSLKQKISSMNLLALSQSIRTYQTENNSAQKETLHKEVHQNSVNSSATTDKFQQCKSSNFPPSEHGLSRNSLQCGRIQNGSIEQINQTQASVSPSNESLQGSPIWSVLLTGDHHLETIEELQHDDDSYSLYGNTENYAFNRTFSSKLGGSGRISDFNDSQISNFHIQPIEKGAVELKDQIDKLIDNKNQKPSNLQLQDQFSLPLKPNTHLSDQKVEEDDEQQSLIVKKLLKINKIHKKHHPLPNLSSPNIPQISYINLPQTTLNHTSKQWITQVNKSHDPFSGICLSHLPTENQPSISEALSILKEYSSLSEVSNLSVLTQNKVNSNKVVKAKFPPKISLIAGKKVKDKENMPY